MGEDPDEILERFGNRKRGEVMKFKHGTRRRALEYEKDWVRKVSKADGRLKIAG